MKLFKEGYLKWSLLGLVIIMLLSGCVLGNPPTEEAQTIQRPEDKIEIIEVDNIILFASRETDGVYEEITVQVDDKNKTFPWVSTTNPTYAPTIDMVDVDDDTVDEVVILLITDHGTGVLQQKIHVLKLEDLTEIDVENPVEAINKKVTSTITKNDGKVNAVIKWDENILEKDFNESDAGFWFDEVAFGAHVFYEIVGSKINATVSGAVSPARFPVTAIVEYDSDLRIESIVVEEGYTDEIDD
ncbi:MAG: hypothetical protein RBR71_09915 [Gudongella sp.]|nr:hypothetical protein [Gudongella sp.]